MSSSASEFRSLDLHGVKVWLSGAVPEPDAKSLRTSSTDPSVETRAGSEAEEGILGFVRAFAGLLFRFGGQLIHGCHPSFTPILLEQARIHRAKSRQPSPLFLAASGYFASPENGADWKRWDQVAHVKITDPSDPRDRDHSLQMLQEYMSNECNAFVAVGGKWWDQVPGRAGVPKELQLAKERKVPCYLLGGFGGISSKFINEQPEWYAGLNNNLSVEDNQLLASLSDITLAAGIIVGRLSKG
jgi:SLOG cluster2